KPRWRVETATPSARARRAPGGASRGLWNRRTAGSGGRQMSAIKKRTERSPSAVTCAAPVAWIPARPWSPVPRMGWTMRNLPMPAARVAGAAIGPMPARAGARAAQRAGRAAENRAAAGRIEPPRDDYLRPAPRQFGARLDRRPGSDVLSLSLLPTSTPAFAMNLLDVRRLTGPGLLLAREGAALEVALGAGDDPAVEIWRASARRLLDAAGWREPRDRGAVRRSVRRLRSRRGGLGERRSRALGTTRARRRGDRGGPARGDRGGAKPAARSAARRGPAPRRRVPLGCGDRLRRARRGKLVLASRGAARARRRRLVERAGRAGRSRHRHERQDDDGPPPGRDRPRRGARGGAHLDRRSGGRRRDDRERRLLGLRRGAAAPARPAGRDRRARGRPRRPAAPRARARPRGCRGGDQRGGRSPGRVRHLRRGRRRGGEARRRPRDRPRGA